jgi:hypothetical protein
VLFIFPKKYWSEIPSLINLSDLRRTSELATTKTSCRSTLFAAAGVSLSYQTMHRAHDPWVETLNERCSGGSFDPPASVSGAVPAAPFVSGAALIWGCLLTVNEKFTNS